MRAIAILFLATIPAAAAERLAEFVTGLHEPFGMDFLDGQLVLTEFGGHRVLRIDSAGKVSVVAGSGQKGLKDGAARNAEFNSPHNLVVAPDGMIYVADTFNHCVRKVNPKIGVVQTIAGGEKGFAGDGGPAANARFDQVYHVAIDAPGKNLYVCDLGNRRIRKIDLAAGTIATVAGNGKRGLPKDGAKATDAPLVDPRAVTIDKAGRLWILERSGNALRVVEDGRIRTIAGTGAKGFAGDGGPAIAAKLNGPKFLWIDPHGDVLIADTENHCIRKVVVKDGSIVRVAGTGKKGKGAGGRSPTEVQLTQPHGVAIGPDGTMYVADSMNGRILKAVK